MGNPQAEDYERNFRFPVGRERNRSRFIRVGYTHERGLVVRCMIAYEVEIGEGMGPYELFQLVRYDTADGGFHRHRPGLPEPLAERTDLGHVPENEQIDYAKREILQCFRAWEMQLLDGNRVIGGGKDR